MARLFAGRSAYGYKGVPVQIKVLVVICRAPVALRVGGAGAAGWVASVSSTTISDSNFPRTSRASELPACATRRALEVAQVFPGIKLRVCGCDTLSTTNRTVSAARAGETTSFGSVKRAVPGSYGRATTAVTSTCAATVARSSLATITTIVVSLPAITIFRAAVTSTTAIP